MQTSFTTVAVFELQLQSSYALRDSDIEIRTTKASGSGGQFVNKTESVIVMTHLPTGIVVRMSNERSQHQNKEMARQVLETRVKEIHENESLRKTNNDRLRQIGYGHRGTKIKTYRWSDSIVIDHRNGNKYHLGNVLKGNVM